MMQPGMMQPGMMQPGMMQPGMMQPGMMQPGMMQPGMPMQIAPGTRVHAQWHGDGQLHPATVRSFENGMYQVDWAEPHLGGNAYVYAQQIQVPSGAPGMAPNMGAPGMHKEMKPDMHGKPGQDMHGKGMQPDYGKQAHDPYGKQQDPYGKQQAHDPYGKQGHDVHGKGMQPDHGKQAHDPYGKQGHDAHGKGGMPQQAMPQQKGSMGHSIGAHVSAQHPNGNWYPGRIVAMQNGMIGVDWDDAKLGQSSWVQPHQVRG
jgi:hypothetical protein